MPWKYAIWQRNSEGWSFSVQPGQAETTLSLSREHGLRQVDYLNKRSRQLEYFIVNGATSNMLSKLFKISSADVTLKRRLFSGTASSLRRPAMPPHPMREKITNRWFEIRKGKESEPLRADDYETLHREFSQYTFATLWAVVHEFDK